jgi:WD40 repeat protein
LISGDAEGKIKIWDSKYGVLINEFSEHESDVVSIIKGENNVLYCTGCDSLIVTIQFNESEWKVTSRFRGQSHDINALLLLNDNCLLSGGVTTDICIYNLKNQIFIEKYDKKLSCKIFYYLSCKKAYFWF